MAIVRETYKVGEKDFVRTYSDRGMLIHGGDPEDDYEEANDPVELNRTYVETDIPIDEVTEAEAFDIIFGGEA